LFVVLRRVCSDLVLFVVLRRVCSDLVSLLS
jgi:hypothetical protein